MSWLMWPALAFILTGLLVAGIVPEDQGLTLMRCWLKFKYAISIWEYALAILGVVLAVAFHILAGFFRLMTFAHGVLMILSEQAAEKIGLYYPTYPNDIKELEE